MATIDDTDHGEQEDEWETVWEMPDHMKAVQAAGDTVQQSYLENVARIAAGPEVESPALVALQRMDKHATGMPAWLEELRHIEDLNKRAQGYVPRRRRKQRAETPIDRQVPERSSMPRREYAHAMPTTDLGISQAVENVPPEKHKRGNPTIGPSVDEVTFSKYMGEYVSQMGALPTQPQFMHYLDHQKHVILARWTLGRYAQRYHQTNWRGCVAHFAHLIQKR